MHETRVSTSWAFFRTKMLPFGLARTLSLATLPCMQILVAATAGKAEAGRFFVAGSFAHLLLQIADLGMSKAFPVIYGSCREQSRPGAALIQTGRWLAGTVAALFLVWWLAWSNTAWTAEAVFLFAMFLLGRVMLMGYQGFHHARGAYDRLWRGSIGNLAGGVGMLGLGLAHGAISADVGAASLAAGTWIELMMLLAPEANPAGLATLLGSCPHANAELCAAPSSGLARTSRPMSTIWSRKKSGGIDGSPLST